MESFARPGLEVLSVPSSCCPASCCLCLVLSLPRVVSASCCLCLVLSLPCCPCRLMASVVGDLWHRRNTETQSQLLIQPCHVRWTIDATHAALTRL
jgi:hypothetical protein